GQHFPGNLVIVAKEYAGRKSRPIVLPQGPIAPASGFILEEGQGGGEVVVHTGKGFYQKNFLLSIDDIDPSGKTGLKKGRLRPKPKIVPGAGRAENRLA